MWQQALPLLKNGKVTIIRFAQLLIAPGDFLKLLEAHRQADFETCEVRDFELVIND